MRILFKEWGPLVEYNGKIVTVEDINPDIKTKWRLSRSEVFVFGFKAIMAACFAKRLD